MLSSRDRLSSGYGFRERGGGGGSGSGLVAVLESELLCWKSHVNENTILGGWLVLKSIQRGSQDFSHFHVVCSSLSLCFLLWLCRGKKKNPLQMVPTTPCILPASSYTPPPTPHPPLSIFPCSLLSWSPLLFLIPLYQHQTGRSGTSVQRLLTVCFQLPCHRLIPPLSVYSGICVRKIHFGMANPTNVWFLRRGDGFQLRSAAYLCEEWSSKTSFVGGINQTVNAVLARRAVSPLTWWPSACMLVRGLMPACVWQNWVMMFLRHNQANLQTFKSNTFKLPAQHIENLSV